MGEPAGFSLAKVDSAAHGGWTVDHICGWGRLPDVESSSRRVSPGASWTFLMRGAQMGSGISLNQLHGYAIVGQDPGGGDAFPAATLLEEKFRDVATELGQT